MNRIILQKKIFRKNIFRRLRKISKVRRGHLSQKITRKALSLPEFRRAKVIAFYISLPSEPDTSKLIKYCILHRKRVAVPICLQNPFFSFLSSKTKLQMNHYGVLEPSESHRRRVPWDTIEVMFIPGIAFDEKSGMRLGRGKGFYDRIMRKTPRAVRVGLGYDLQLCQGVPSSRKDLPVDMMITEKRVVRFTKK